MKNNLLLPFLLLFISCKNDDVSNQERDLLGNWDFKGYLIDTTIFEPCIDINTKVITLTINRDGKKLQAGGISFVNQYTSTLISDSNSLTFENLISTEKGSVNNLVMLCEEEYYKSLKGTKSFEIVDSKLYLKPTVSINDSKEKAIMVLERNDHKSE